MLKGLSVVCNAALVLFTLAVLATDGAPNGAIYYAFTALLLAVPIFTLFALLRAGTGEGVRRLAAACNLVLAGSVSLAVVDQYPHPKEAGVTEFVLLCLASPVRSALLLLRRRPGAEAPAQV